MHAHYARVYWTFFRNSLVREMSFRGNFIITVLTRAFWFAAQLTLFEIIFRNVGRISDWSREEYFAFMATRLLLGATLLSESSWWHAPIPSVFHLVLAGFLLVAGHFHAFRS